MKRKTKLILFLIVIIIAFIGFSFYLSKENFMPGKGELEEKEAVTVSEPGKPEKPQKAEEEKEVVRKKIAPPGQEEDVTAATPPVSKKSEYELLLAKVKQFCGYLDKRDYVAAYRLQGGSYNRFLRIISVLSENRPIISGETQSLSTLTSNMHHIYRTIRMKNISLVKDILVYEKDKTEPALDLFYRWIMLDIKQRNGETDTSLESLYEYAAFFLSTIGGRSYLLRRDSRTRILITYYSVLIVNEANRANKNHYGIDIRDQVDLLIGDITQYKGLEYGGWYLKNLQTIQENIRKRI